MKLLLLLSIIALSSCTHLNSVSQTSIPKKKGKLIKASTTKNIIFFFVFDTNYVNNLIDDLKNQCPNGDVKGILTKDIHKTYFPVIFSQRIVEAEGYCNE